MDSLTYCIIKALIIKQQEKSRRQISLQSQIVGCVLVFDMVEEFDIVSSVSLMYYRVGALIHESVGEGLYCRLEVRY